MVGELKSCPKCGGRLGEVEIVWFDDENPRYDEWGQECESCEHTHTLYANYEDPQYDPQAYRAALTQAGQLAHLATDPDALQIVRDTLPPDDPIRQRVEELRAMLDEELAKDDWLGLA